MRSRSGYDSGSSDEDMSDESAAEETPLTARSGGRKSINKGRWSKEEVRISIQLGLKNNCACSNMFDAVQEKSGSACSTGCIIIILPSIGKI